MQDSIEAPVLEEHQIDDPPITSQQVRLCFAFFENIIFCPCSIYVYDFFLSEFDICCFMQASSQAQVLGEHHIDDPPLMSQYVRLCIAFF